MSDIPLAQQFSRFAANLRFEDLPESTIHEARRRVIDSLGCALGAYSSEPATIARKLAGTVTSTMPATVIGSGHRSSPDLAAFANGVQFRYLDYNDTYLSLEPAHPSDNIAAVFGVAEPVGAHGRDIITAIVLAYEIQCRLCDAASIRARGWDHVTYGSFSTSLAAGKLLGLTEEQLTHAQGLAGVPNNAMRQTRVGMLSHWKGCAFANASRNGVFAALLASYGMTGPSDVFEGEMGFFKQVSGPFQVAPLGGDGFMIDRTYIKFYPAEYHSQSAIDAALALRPDVHNIDEIDRIVIETFTAAVEIIGHEPEKWRPTTRETADHSLPYCVAVALMDGKVTRSSFDNAHLNDKRLLDLVSRIEVRADAELDKRYPDGIPNRIRIYCKDGGALEEEVTYPRGHFKNPMSDQEVEMKFKILAEPLLPAHTVYEILQRCWSLDAQPDIGAILRLMRVPDDQAAHIGER
jgi:2-methylcitrate dehydratase